tara:strand:+ start:752 stop:949 length:198 start_codon:yes stop_codon:yes gene_type:complete
MILAFELLNDVQLAKRWQMTRKTLIRWRSEGTGPPFVRIGRSILYRMADVEAYEQANRQNTTNNK